MYLLEDILEKKQTELSYSMISLHVILQNGKLLEE